MADYEGWPTNARDLVEQAIERHGGRGRFERISSVQLNLSGLSGPVPYLKGLGRTHQLPDRLRVSPHQWRAEVELAGQAVTYDRGRLIPGGGSERANYRESFRGLRNKLRPWSDLDASYFYGYALCTYLSVPFVLPRMRLVAVANRGGLAGVTVDFSRDFPSHCARQSFYFDDAGLLRRHDYHAEILGPWAKGAHYSTDYVNVDGLAFARQRYVVAAPRGVATPVPVLRARFEGFRIDFGTPDSN